MSIFGRPPSRSPNATRFAPAFSPVCLPSATAFIHPASGAELYDLSADPAEAHNLIADPAAGEVLRDLRSRLSAWMQRNEDPALSWAVF